MIVMRDLQQLEGILAGIGPVDQAVYDAAWDRLNNLTKPRGSLGKLETLAARVCAIRGKLDASLGRKIILTFAGDHGVVAEGVSAFPQEVTPQMVLNFLNQGAGVNVLARHVGAEVRVIDVGVAASVAGAGLICRKILHGTANMVQGAAMSVTDALRAISAGMEVAGQAIEEGAGILGTGDMGIGNTTPSAALFAVMLGIDVDDVTGRGTGIDDRTLKHKKEVIRKALYVNRGNFTSPVETLAAVGGLEIAAICGAVIEAARRRIPVVVDGFVSSAGALVAIKLNKHVLDYCIFSHMSAEPGHSLFFKKIGVYPLLHLDMRLGEGTGAALAMGLVEAGLKIMNEMATFGDAGVSREI